MCLVHVQSTRKPDRAFCGMPIPVGSRPRQSSPGRDGPSSFYVSALEIEDLLRRVPGIARRIPLCPGCVVNFRRAGHAASGSPGAGVLDGGADEGDASGDLVADDVAPSRRGVPVDPGVLDEDDGEDDPR
jgi:hypothetical protein